MSTLDNRNELISGCRHSKKFLLNTVLTWLVLVANLTCCKHHLSTTHHAPTPRLAFIVLFYLMIRLARGMTLWVAINVQDIIQSHQSTSIIYIHIYSFIKKLKSMQPPNKFLVFLKLQKILGNFASPNRYFTENSRWVPLICIGDFFYVIYVLLPKSEVSHNDLNSYLQEKILLKKKKTVLRTTFILLGPSCSIGGHG